MKTMSGIRMAASLAVAGTMLGAGSVSAEGLVIGGYVQGSYQYNMNKPKAIDTDSTSSTFGQNIPTGNQLRSFDANQEDDFNIPAVQLSATKAVGDDNYGYGLKLMFGRDAASLQATDVAIEEAYATYALSSLKGLSFTGGKFVTAEGVEVIESPLNLTITHGYLFGLAEPFTHMGAKANYTVNDKVSVMAGLSNGWDNDNDNNRGKTWLWQVATKPLETLTANLQGTYGPELNDQTHVKRNSVDLVLGYSGIERLSLSAQANWGQDDDDSMTADVWKGVGLWAGYAVTDLINPGVRFEVFDDQNGGSRSGTSQTVKNLTLVNKFQLAKNLFARAEYRHDFSNMPAFQSKDGGAVRVQNTVAGDLVVLF